MLNKPYRIFLGAFLFTAFRSLIQPLLQSIPQRLVASIENGVHLEDALGRQFVLPIECVRTWNVRYFTRCRGDPSYF